MRLTSELSKVQLVRTLGAAGSEARALVVADDLVLLRVLHQQPLIVQVELAGGLGRGLGAREAGGGAPAAAAGASPTLEDAAGGSAEAGAGGPGGGRVRGGGRDRGLVHGLGVAEAHHAVQLDVVLVHVRGLGVVQPGLQLQAAADLLQPLQLVRTQLLPLRALLLLSLLALPPLLLRPLLLCLLFLHKVEHAALYRSLHTQRREADVTISPLLCFHCHIHTLTVMVHKPFCKNI